MKKIAWITADCFIDVDLPIIPQLTKSYDIHWFICINKLSIINHKSFVIQKLEDFNLHLDFIGLNRRNRNPFIAFEYLKLILKVKRQKAEIYYIDMPGMPYFLPLLRLLIGSKQVVIATHNVSTPKGASNERMADLYMRFTLKLFYNFHVFSNSQKDVLESKYPHKKVLLTPLALKDYGKSLKTPGPFITFLNFGIIRDYKRVDVLIQATNLAFERTKKIFIVKIVGACANWNKYQALIKYPFLFDLKIESIRNEEIADIFASSHYFVLPYQDIAQSGAITVAFNYNLPVIASKLNSFKELITDKQTGFLFDVASTVALTDIMVYILENHFDIYPHLIKNQKKFVEENFVIESITKKYSNFFERLTK